MKKKIYIGAFTLFGILLQLLIHGLVEVFYINLLLGNFEKYSFGLSWGQLYAVHHIGTVIFLIAGILFGFLAGKFFWKKIYEK